MFKNWDYRCTECDLVFVELVDDALRDELQHCPTCGCFAQRTLSAPMVLTASHPDGTRRFADLRTISALRQQHSASSNYRERKALQREIRKVSKLEGGD